MERHGIDISRCAVNTDFGRGFYTTTLEPQARHWAWDRYYKWQKDNPGISGNQPAILRFRVRRYSLTNPTSDLDHGLSELASLVFVRGDYANEDFWSLVQHCRQSTPEDKKRGIVEIVHDHKKPPGGWYELVSGPVAAFWQQRVAMTDSDQFSFHADGVRLLTALMTKGKGKGPLGTGDPDYYEWFPVP
jgi:hypothetical protein